MDDAEMPCMVVLPDDKAILIADAWSSDQTDGFLTVIRKDGAHLAIFAPGTWLYVHPLRGQEAK